MGHDPRGSGGGVARGRWEQNRPARTPSFDLVLPARAQSLVVERRQGEEVSESTIALGAASEEEERSAVARGRLQTRGGRVSEGADGGMASVSEVGWALTSETREWPTRHGGGGPWMEGTLHDQLRVSRMAASSRKSNPSPSAV